MNLFEMAQAAREDKSSAAAKLLAEMSQGRSSDRDAS